ncbi:efflux protein [Moniliophthora roreri MCA 2997]|uniref:Efflux protein n=2 Tax=Moniliophthora roreri TaxID=221103 RepID=V2XND6_MONRO|nr:efflux protein [Moniliophthora roreri MCA 2997]KAI3606420.1 efflux protein [Moniliophthora roreri]
MSQDPPTIDLEREKRLESGTNSSFDSGSANHDLEASTKKEAGVTVSVTSSDVTPQSELPRLRKHIILLVVSWVQFFDIFNSCSAIIALPEIEKALGFTQSTLQWVLSAYTLTFAACMLIAGRVCDIFHPKPVFLTGCFIVGLLGIPLGASVHPIMTIVLRAAQGIGAAMTIPSAVSMVTTTFPDPNERGRAYAIYGAFGAVGNALGFVLGGVISSKASWRWVFYLIAILMTPFGIIAWFVLPNPQPGEGSSKGKTLDWPGVGTLTAGLVLFVYAITEAGSQGWRSPAVLATLIISIFLFGGFLLVEKLVSDPAFPPRTWFYKNFTPMFFYAWTVYWWLFSIELQLVQVFQNLWGLTSIAAAIRCIPLGIVGGVTAYLVGLFAPKTPRIPLLLSGQVLMAVGSVLFALAVGEDKYWSYVVPGIIVGTSGLSLAYVGSMIVVMEGAKPGQEGVVSAVMYTAYQIGATLGLAIVTSITVGVNQGRAADPISQHVGYAASFWSILGANGVGIFITILFVRN